MKRAEKRQAKRVEAKKKVPVSVSGQLPIGDVPKTELEILYCRTVRTMNKSQQILQAIEVELTKRETPKMPLGGDTEEKK